MSVPDGVRTLLRQNLWRIADDLGWMCLSPVDKKQWYENWTKDEAIGGVLRRYLHAGHVRVYIKDTVLKGYPRSRLADHTQVYRVLDLNGAAATEKYQKPHGHRLRDNRIICWGRADNWKTILMATFERALMIESGLPYAAILLYSTGRYHEESSRNVVQSAADKLGIVHLKWLD